MGVNPDSAEATVARLAALINWRNHARGTMLWSQSEIARLNALLKMAQEGSATLPSQSHGGIK